MQVMGVAKTDGVKTSSPSATGFWRRQFQARATGGQKIFDWLGGVILPVACFVFDPMVFKSSNIGAPILGKYKAFAYLLSFISVMAMSAWLIWAGKLNWLNAFLAGLFLTGTVVSLIIGVILFPFSVLGLSVWMPIALLGFTPLFSAIVFLRNTVRAYRTSKPLLENKVFAGAFTLGVIFSAVVPWTINTEISRSFEKMKAGNAETVKTETGKLKFVAPLVNFEDLATVYYSTLQQKDGEKTTALAMEYKEMTGNQLYR